MKGASQWLCVLGSCAALPVEVLSKLCSGGYHCTSPHECCVQGCCLFIPSPAYNPTDQADNLNHLNPAIKYYVWLTLFGIAFTVCFVWWCKSRRTPWRCWWRCSGRSSASEPDSAGSCYYPPQYSRCGSLCRVGSQPAPPPYNEVTSKPDLYPMVIYLGADKGDGDYMVQYYKNYIVRPSGSLSATSTVDSLSSSFLCNTANEANTLIPPPYSCAGSLEWSCSGATAAQRQALLRSISSVTCHEDNRRVTPRRQLHHSTSVQISSSAITENGNYSQNDEENNQLPHSSNVNGSAVNLMPTRVKSLSSVIQSKASLDNTVGQYSRCRDNQAGGATSSASNHQYFNVWDYKSGDRAEALDSDKTFNLDGNYSPKAETSGLKMSKYLTGISSESLEENNQQIGTYSNYAPKILQPQTPENPYHDDNMCINNNLGLRNGQTALQLRGGEVKKSNSDKKYEDFTFPNNRDESNCNLNSLEENQMCSFFSQSLAGCQNTAMSSDYSIFNKNFNNFGSKEEMLRMYSIGNSMTGSEISSLANLGTPDSPPRATSPTSEVKELLDKIQQLPMDVSRRDDEDNDESFFVSDVSKAKRYFNKSRKSLYMPLNLVPNSKTFHHNKTSPSSGSNFMRQMTKKGWLSRSAPTTPCGLVPATLAIPHTRTSIGSNKALRGSKGGQRNEADNSPLLTEQDVSGDEIDNANK